MRSLTDNEIAVVSGGDVIITAPKWGWERLSANAVDKLIEQHAGAAAAVPIAIAFILGLLTEYAYDAMGGKEGIDEKVDEFEKWCDEKAKEIAAAGKMAYEDAKCALQTLGKSGVGGGAPMTCSIRGANGSW